jgi:uncharacterized protein (DUF952 family)
MIDALIAAAQQAEALERSQLFCPFLVERPASRTQQEQRPWRIDGFDRGEDRLGLHHHSGAATERSVVDRAMHIGGVVAQVVCSQIEQLASPSPAKQTLGAERVDETREDGEHVDLHGVQAYEAMIFHITDTATWADSLRRGKHTGSTRGIDLAEEGYIHCSTADQWPGVIERFYADATDLLLLHIDEESLTSPLVYEQLPGAPGTFPHIYGPINLEAVVTTEPITHG